jgi:hypothetical protein
VTNDANAAFPRLAAIDRRQILLRAVDVEKLIDEDHSGRSIWELVGRLDLSLYHAQIKSVTYTPLAFGPADNCCAEAG